MTDGTKAKDPRAERLKAALRDNLRRRKAQIRERAGEGPAKGVPSNDPHSQDQERRDDGKSPGTDGKSPGTDGKSPGTE
ncbi:hypothetical protein G3T14_00640 [Methylobacterium sp. BTF04]|uniref:hypothetical protein n=1 Tax=Methylobacterium sp. BTF04 TaxID=2708300 RepID=UPI0013D19686|nr:hypothetical protein [Methylobacterium sp. BTF04]NEU10635.1 hypothetical protein [Methylobacterium sp. BTF04]